MELSCSSIAYSGARRQIRKKLEAAASQITHVVEAALNVGGHSAVPLRKLPSRRAAICLNKRNGKCQTTEFPVTLTERLNLGATRDKIPHSSIYDHL